MNVGHILSTAAESFPDRKAIIWGDQIQTYAQFDLRASALAGGLHSLGLSSGDRAGVLMWNAPQLLESFFGVWKAGGCVVPLNARFRRDEIVYHLKDSAALAIVFGEEFREVMAEVKEHLPLVQHFICTGEPLAGQIGYEELLGAHLQPKSPKAVVSDDDLAWLFYTSGTTGRPKGAMLTHANLTFMAVGWVADLMHLEPEDVGLHAAPLTHGAGFHAVALTLKAAAQVILRPPRFDAASFFATVQSERVTNTWLVPTQIKILLKDASLERWDLSSLKWIVYGGSPMYVSDLRQALERIGRVFVQLYGQGETPMTGTYLRVEEHITEEPESKLLASCGRPRSGIEVRILNRDDEEVGRGDAGEICVRGPTIMKGYWDRPEATAEALRNGWLHTGDIGYMDDRGYVYILDRNKDMIITGGSNVYPREVEEVLLQHPAVLEASVIGVPHEFWGEEVQGVVVLKPRMTTTGEELIAFVAERIADYKKPHAIHFVSELPKSAYGKVLKRELRDRYCRNSLSRT